MVVWFVCFSNLINVFFSTHSFAKKFGVERYWAQLYCYKITADGMSYKVDGIHWEIVQLPNNFVWGNARLLCSMVSSWMEWWVQKGATSKRMAWWKEVWNEFNIQNESTYWKWTRVIVAEPIVAQVVFVISCRSECLHSKCKAITFRKAFWSWLKNEEQIFYVGNVSSSTQ